jgi:hypothetical protein
MAQNSALNQSINSATQNQNSSQITNSNAFVFNNLSQFQAHQIVLQANLTTNQVNQVLQFFQANQQNTVTQAAAFPIATPGCI